MALRKVAYLGFVLSAFAVGCGDDSTTGGNGGGPDQGGSDQGGSDQGGSDQGGSDQGGSGGGPADECEVIPSASLVLFAGSGDYSYHDISFAPDTLVLDLFNGLDSTEIDLATDSKNNTPATCEACGWYFENGSGSTATRIFYHASGAISLDVANFAGQLETQPSSGTLTNVIYREVTLSDPNDLYSATFVPNGACVRVESGSF